MLHEDEMGKLGYHVVWLHCLKHCAPFTRNCGACCALHKVAMCVYCEKHLALKTFK
jgi:hypothetical protein